MYKDLKFGEFADVLAARSPVPGGGTASAAVSAIGVSLAIMALRYSQGESSASATAALETAKERLLLLMDEDSAAYGKVKDAMTLPQATPEEKKRRSGAIQEALHGAAEVPLRAMETALDGLKAIRSFYPDCNKNLFSDLRCGVLFLTAGINGCFHNVVVNTDALKDKIMAERLSGKGREIALNAKDIALFCGGELVS